MANGPKTGLHIGLNQDQVADLGIYGHFCNFAEVVALSGAIIVFSLSSDPHRCLIQRRVQQNNRCFLNLHSWRQPWVSDWCRFCPGPPLCWHKWRHLAPPPATRKSKITTFSLCNILLVTCNFTQNYLACLVLLVLELNELFICCKSISSFKT